MSKPVRRHNRNYSGGFPLAVGDRFYSQDIFRNDAYHESMTGIAYNDLTQQTAPYVINGLVAAQGAGHTMDISAGKAVVPFTVTIPDPSAGWTVPPSTTTANIDMVIDYAGATGVSLTGTTTDGATPNYVKMSYTETNGNTRTRAKKAGSYAYEVYDTVTVTIDAVAPTSTEINLLTFTTNGATVTVTNNGNTRIGSPYHMQDAVVYDQASFNDCIRRVAANQYKIRDDIQSIYCAYLSGGYDMYSGSSPLSGGDTWGYIETNNCKQVIFESGAFLYFQDTRGYLEINTDDCYLQNVKISGLGTTPISNLNYSFLLNGNRVLFSNCSTDNRNSTGNYRAFQGSATAAHNLTSKYINCIARDMTIGGGTLNGGFRDSNNLVNCQILNFDYTGAAAGAFGFNNCNNLENCIIEALSGAGNFSYGYSSCEVVNNCIANLISSSLNDVRAFNICDNVSNCKATNISSSSGDAIGFYSCDFVSTCTAKTIDHNGSVASQNAYGFNLCNNISSCFADDVDTNGAGGVAHGYITCTFISASNSTNNGSAGFDQCDSISNCFADNNGTYGFGGCDRINTSLSTNNGTWGFISSVQMNTNRATGNTSGSYSGCFADFGATQAVADTATGGYNG